MKRNDGKVRFVVRNMPLPFHQYAVPAAIAAESAKDQGEFWPVHDALIKEPLLDPAHLDHIVANARLNLKRYSQSSSRAKVTIAEDSTDFRRLGLTSTPSFLLLCPNGDVFLLGSVFQMDSLIK